eukprot:CAMPEP_0201990248 /NCGR_PEP_ID=MMETSP0904-20121228/93276_1 /ASSEMBLY_ACC=CAM_ASM_000553 /TAXON_ID=420261 /ORGANISM="Thalassiosira antarctica, Strain CCMP982" /LENGTH=240 /DNA_ID=CAMNT_0048544505 /DNA_START=58 /DNA_END=780 /DNA_ORIENTATION=-
MDLIVDFPPCHSSRNMPSPRVSFADHLEINIIENLSQEFKDDVWFTQREIKSFTYQVIMTLRIISSTLNMTVAQYAEMNVHDTSAFMGLENYLSKDTTENIRYGRDAIRKAVLLEQHRQLDLCIHDPDAISLISERVSELSRKRAHIIGLLHAEKRKTEPLDHDRTYNFVPACQSTPPRKLDAISIISSRVFELSRKCAHIIGSLHGEKMKTQPLDDSTLNFVPVCQTAPPGRLDQFPPS